MKEMRIVPLEKLNQRGKQTLVSTLGIEVTRQTSTEIEGTMPVDERTIQPFGFLHGGATGVLLESLGSIGSNLVIDQETQSAFGQSFQCHHLRSVTEGKVKGVCRIEHAGRSRHLWLFEMFDEDGKKCASGSLTVAVVPKRV